MNESGVLRGFGSIVYVLIAVRQNSRAMGQGKALRETYQVMLIDINWYELAVWKTFYTN